MYLFFLYSEETSDDDDIFYSRDVTGHRPVPVGAPPCRPAGAPRGLNPRTDEIEEEEDSGYDDTDSEREDSGVTMSRPKTPTEMMSELGGFVTRINLLEKFALSVPSLHGTSTRRKIENTVVNSKCYAWTLLTKFTEEGQF